MKTHQRLDNTRLSQALADRQLVDPRALKEAAQFSSHSKRPFTEALVSANLVADWELARVVCEIFGLPFLPVELLQVDMKAAEGIDKDFLIENCLVPIARHGQVLSIAMPAMVPAEVLGQLAAMTDLTVLPVVGTVNTNRQWITEHLEVQPAAPLPSSSGEHDGGDWGSIFDQGDAAVLNELQPPEEQR